MGNTHDAWKNRLASFDFEVTAYDWLLVVKKDGQYYVFHNDPYGVEEFINSTDYIWVAYNCKHYDNYILKGVLNHYTPEYIKDINDHIIVDKQDGWTYSYDKPFVKIPPTCDLMLDMPQRQSLKHLEGNMLMDIRESTIDFNIDHPWTEEEFEEMLFYCKHDVDAVEKLIKEREDYLDAKVSLGELCGLSIEESLYKTNAQLSAISLGAEKVERNDYHDYQFPKELDQSMIPQDILDYVNRFKTVDESEIKEDNVKLKWSGDIAGAPHVIGLGGIHGAVKNYIEESDENRIIVNYDVSSYYPSLLIEYDYLSRNIADKQIYIDYYHNRLAAKKAGDKKTANGLKLVLNTTYGASLNKYNDLYDPLMGVSTCLTGQLLLTQLIKTLERDISSFRLIQSNTDGIMFSVDRVQLDDARKIVEAWSESTRLGMEEDQIDKVVQKDVNNYIIKMSNGKLKYKGTYVSDYPCGDFSHNSMSIVAEAIIKKLIEDVPVEDTINSCDDPFRFQLIAKTGSTYDKTVHYVDGEEIEVQKVNRLYAVDDDRYGVVKKVKKQYLELDEDGERRYYINLKGKRTYKKKWETDENGDFFIKKDTTQNCPEHAFIDNSCQITIDKIDKTWYIKLANKRINDFLGIKEVKKKMATTAKTKLEPRPALYQKIFALGEYLSKQKYITDGYNDAQGYEYVKSAYYRKVLGEGCRSVGLVFKFSIANRLFAPLEKTKNMNLTTILGTISLIDPDTGEFEDYSILADGSDNLDKGIYKAETMAIKYFVLNNFLLPETQDDVDPENGKDEKALEKEEKKSEKKSTKSTVTIEEEKKPTPPPTAEEREKAAEEVVSDNEPTEEFVRQMIANIETIRTVKGDDYGTRTYNNLHKVLNGEMTMTKADAIKTMTSLEERMDELGLE